MSRKNVLITADEAERLLGTPTVAYVELGDNASSEDAPAYFDGRLPGALWLDWRRDLQQYPRRHIVARQNFTGLMRRRGIANEDTVILYSDDDNVYAAFAYWVFKIFGHQDVRILDGGRKKWEAEGRPLQKQRPQPDPSTYEAAAPDRSLRATRDDVTSTVGTSTIIDVRDHQQFREPGGWHGFVSAPAHVIPGSVNIPWRQAMNPDGTFKTNEELATLYTPAQDTGGRDTIVYGQTGEASALTWFALSQLLDRPGVRNYDGSWLEYQALMDAPFATAAA